MCAHDSSIKSITVTSKRPKIIKLHGDYLFDDIKSTLRETESLEENIKKKFIQFSKEFGLIVVGYSGNDRSIMDIISYLLKHDDYFKGGIYWCIRKNDPISDELRKLLWKDRVFFIEINGFDEFFAEVHRNILGNTLPIDTNLISNKSRLIIDTFINNETLNNVDSETIKSDLDKLRSQNNKNILYELLKKVNSDKEQNASKEFSDNEMMQLIQVENCIAENDYDGAKKLAIGTIQNTKNKDFKIKLYIALITGAKAEKQITDALSFCDNVIEIDNKNPIHLLEKSKLLDNISSKTEYIKKALELDEYFHTSYYRYAIILIDKYKHTEGIESNELFKTILSYLDKGISVHPSIINPCWFLKFDFIKMAHLNSETKKTNLLEIADKVKEQGIYSLSYINMQLDLSLKKYNLEKDDSEILQHIQKAKEHSPDSNNISYDMLNLVAHGKLNLTVQLKECFTKFDTKYQDKAEYVYLKADLLLRKLDCLQDAIDELESFNNSNNEFDIDISKLLFQCYLYDDNIIAAEELLEKELTPHLNDKILLFQELKIIESKGDFKQALEKIKNLTELTGDPAQFINRNVYLHLLLKEYDDAIRLSKFDLEENNFSILAETQIINYEFARLKKSNDKPNKLRIQKVIDNSSSEITKAAAYCLLNKKTECYKHIDNAIEKDCTIKYDIKIWPIFKSIKQESKFAKYYEK